MFNEPHDFAISNSNFHITTNRYGRSGIDILREASSLGAVFDSNEHYDRRCFPGTREQYIADITNWASESVDIPPSIYWMWGPAGVGKSAIAQTCAEILKESGHLGAAFFFTVKKHNDPLRLFTTIAYQLAIALPDYRAIIDEKISKDKALVEKRMSSQFKSLIVEPFQELEKQGKGIKQRVIFIDGLDECAGEDAQAEIIEIIASSVHAGSTSFCWAVFSRSEPRIVSTFNQDDIISITRSVELPISRKADGEIELYIRGEFKNILRRHNCLRLSSSWPTDKDVKMLIDAAAGLFAHPAAVLRFVGYPSDWQFQERLQAVIDAILRPGTGKQPSGTSGSLAALDALYLLIMSRIPDDLLLSVQFLLRWITATPPDSPYGVAILCCALGFSESMLRRVCHHLHAVIAYQETPEPTSSLDPRIDLTRSFYDQGQWFQPDDSFQNLLFTVLGNLRFHHKSFYDFLFDPARSSTFCITNPAISEKFLDHCIRQHHHYASSFSIKDSKLVLTPDVASSSASLSWSQGTEFVDSFLKLWTFYNVSYYTSLDQVGFDQFLEVAPPSYLQRMEELDWRKDLLAETTVSKASHSLDTIVVGLSGISRVFSHTMLECLRTDNFDAFEPTIFLAMVQKLKKAGVIRPYHPRFGSSRAVSILHTFSGQKPYDKNSGLYKLGHGDKSVIWYWEFDTGKRYFHQFRTVNYAEAVEIYKANKFTMWEDAWGAGDGEDREDGSGEDEFDENNGESDVDNENQCKEGRRTREDKDEDEAGNIDDSRLSI